MNWLNNKLIGFIFLSYETLNNSLNLNLFLFFKPDKFLKSS